MVIQVALGLTGSNSARPFSGFGSRSGAGSPRDSGVSAKRFASGSSDTLSAEPRLGRTAFLSGVSTLAPTVHSAGAPSIYAGTGTDEGGYLNFKLFDVEKSDEGLGMAL